MEPSGWRQVKYVTSVNVWILHYHSNLNCIDKRLDALEWAFGRKLSIIDCAFDFSTVELLDQIGDTGWCFVIVIKQQESANTRRLFQQLKQTTVARALGYFTFYAHNVISHVKLERWICCHHVLYIWVHKWNERSEYRTLTIAGSRLSRLDRDTPKSFS